MKIGDKLYCKKSYFHGGDKWLTKDKCYEIINDERASLSIIDDEDESNNRVLQPETFKKHFYTEKEYRKEKLKKINECR